MGRESINTSTADDSIFWKMSAATPQNRKSQGEKKNDNETQS